MKQIGTTEKKFLGDFFQCQNGNTTRNVKDILGETCRAQPVQIMLVHCRLKLKNDCLFCDTKSLHGLEKKSNNIDWMMHLLLFSISKLTLLSIYFKYKECERVLDFCTAIKSRNTSVKSNYRNSHHVDFLHFFKIMNLLVCITHKKNRYGENVKETYFHLEINWLVNHTIDIYI